MKNISLDCLYGRNFSLNFINVLKQFWRKGTAYHQSVPKAHNNLLLLYKCSAKYTLPSGDIFFAHSGDVVFAPKDSLYKVEFFDFDPQVGNTIGINLHLYDADGEELCLSKQPFLAATGESHDFHDLFERINENGTVYPPCMAQIYSDLYRIFSVLTSESDRRSYASADYASIAKAIVHLRCEDAYTMKISEMAQECGVSDSYLRRQFKRYSGMSPSKYVRLRKLLAAKTFLQYSDMPLDEIAYRLNFTDTAYFCKIFRQETKHTPTQYRSIYGIDCHTPKF